MNNDMITLKEAADIISMRFGTSFKPSTIKSNIIHYGLMPEAVKIGRDWFVPRQWAETYVPKRHRSIKKLLTANYNGAMSFEIDDYILVGLWSNNHWSWHAFEAEALYRGRIKCLGGKPYFGYVLEIKKEDDYEKFKLLSDKEAAEWMKIPSGPHGEQKVVAPEGVNLRNPASRLIPGLEKLPLIPIF